MGVISYRYLSIEGRFGEDFELGKELRGGFEEASKSCRLILNFNSSTLTVSPFKRVVLERFLEWLLDPKSIKNRFRYEA